MIARPRPPFRHLPACPVRDVPHRCQHAGRSLPLLCDHSRTQTPRSCPLRPARRRAGNKAPTEKEEDRELRGVRFCPACFTAPTQYPEPRSHALPEIQGVSHPRARGKARPKLGALRIRPRGRLAPWPRPGSPSGLSLLLQAAAAAARSEDTRKREGTVSGGAHPPPSLPPAGPLLTVLGLKFPHVAVGPGPTLWPGSQVHVRGSSQGRVNPALRATRGAWIWGQAVGLGLARQPETPARVAAGLPLSARSRDGALTAVLAAPPAAADRSTVDRSVSFTLRLY